MDRAVIEGDPHAVIEGMIIGAYALGASEGNRLYPGGISPGHRAAENWLWTRAGNAVSLEKGFSEPLSILKSE